MREGGGIGGGGEGEGGGGCGRVWRGAGCRLPHAPLGGTTYRGAADSWGSHKKDGQEVVVVVVAARRDPKSRGSALALSIRVPPPVCLPGRLDEALVPRETRISGTALPLITREIEVFIVVKNPVSIQASRTARRGGAPPSARRTIFPADKEQLLASFD